MSLGRAGVLRQPATLRARAHHRLRDRLRLDEALAAGRRRRRRRDRAHVRALLGVVIYRLFNLWLPIVPALAVMPPIDELRRDFDAADVAEEDQREERD